MELNVIHNGIYPIAYDENNILLNDINPTYPRIPGTIISEGQLIGHRCIYIKLSGCNLRCAWEKTDGNGSLCDSFKETCLTKGTEIDLKVLLKIIRNNTTNIDKIYITGGEPLLQWESIRILVDELHKLKLYVILETNGTLYDEVLVNTIDYLILSPKLTTSIPWKDNLKNTEIEYIESYALKHNFLRKRINFLIDFIKIRNENNKLLELKFTISKESDIAEIHYDYLRYLNKYIKQSQITLVPEGNTIEDLKGTAQISYQAAIENNWFFSHRLNCIL